MLKNKYHNNSNILEAGCDEAGRGCLAGPVYAAAVILPHDFYHPLLNDSKRVKPEHRYELRHFIEKNALTYAIGYATVEEIEKFNIQNASFLAMHRAIEKLDLIPQFILVDGNRFKPFPNIPHQCIVKGDSLFASIAAASILAKTYRDDFMNKIHEQYPTYNWRKNKGYPTAQHISDILQKGLTIHHRKSFCAKYMQLTLNFNS